MWYDMSAEIYRGKIISRDHGRQRARQGILLGASLASLALFDFGAPALAQTLSFDTQSVLSTIAWSA